jgi:hypothetical protein
MRRMVALYGLMAALGLFVAWELVTPDDTAPAAVAASPAGPVHTAGSGPARSPPREFDADALADIAASITQRPLLSPNRRPSTRPANAAGAQAVRDEVPRLTGVIVGPSGGWAIFSGADGKSHAAAAGDAVGAFKVRAIGPGVVTLTGPEGDRVLHPTYVTPPDARSPDVTYSEVPRPGANRDSRSREGAK